MIHLYNIEYHSQYCCLSTLYLSGPIFPNQDLWRPIGTRINHRIHREPYIHPDPYGPIRTHSDPSRSIGIYWVNQNLSGSIWIHLDPSGSIWIHLDPSESIWTHRDPSGPIGIHLDPSCSKIKFSRFTTQVTLVY